MIFFTIPCVPPRVTAQQKGACRTPAGIRFFKKRPVQQAENSLLALLRPFAPAAPLGGPLRMCVDWRMPWRKSETKSRRAAGARWCDVRPDLSNMIKLLEDCLTTLRFWEDDSQVCDVRLTKRWAGNAGITVCIESLEELGAAARPAAAASENGGGVTTEGTEGAEGAGRASLGGVAHGKGGGQ